jgi:hypothetical protein
VFFYRLLKLALNITWMRSTLPRPQLDRTCHEIRAVEIPSGEIGNM